MDLFLWTEHICQKSNIWNVQSSTTYNNQHSLASFIWKELWPWPKVPFAIQLLLCNWCWWINEWVQKVRTEISVKSNQHPCSRLTIQKEMTIWRLLRKKLMVWKLYYLIFFLKISNFKMNKLSEWKKTGMKYY